MFSFISTIWTRLTPSTGSVPSVNLYYKLTRNCKKMIKYQILTQPHCVNQRMIQDFGRGFLGGRRANFATKILILTSLGSDYMLTWFFKVSGCLFQQNGEHKNIILYLLPKSLSIDTLLHPFKVHVILSLQSIPRCKWLG